MPKPPGKESEMRRNYMVIIDWTDGGVDDSDDLVVFAASPAKAIELARAIWSATKGAEWPSCRISKVWILTKRMMRSFV